MRSNRQDEEEEAETRKGTDEMQMYRARVAASVAAGWRRREEEGCLNFRYFNRAAYSRNKSFLLGCL